VHFSADDLKRLSIQQEIILAERENMFRLRKGVEEKKQEKNKADQFLHTSNLPPYAELLKSKMRQPIAGLTYLCGIK
jgi:hypothetical protein